VNSPHSQRNGSPWSSRPRIGSRAGGGIGRSDAASNGPNDARQREQERLERIYMNQVEDPKGQLGPYGLRQYLFRADSGYHDQDLLVGTAPQGLVVLLCTKLASDILSPSCMRDMPLGNGLALSYRFKRAHLSQWRIIDTRIRALMDAFTEKI
jgi:hypothetical protein